MSLFCIMSPRVAVIEETTALRSVVGLTEQRR